MINFIRVKDSSVYRPFVTDIFALAFQLATNGSRVFMHQGDRPDSDTISLCEDRLIWSRGSEPDTIDEFDTMILSSPTKVFYDRVKKLSQIKNDQYIIHPQWDVDESEFDIEIYMKVVR